MHRTPKSPSRRAFLKAASAGLAATLVAPADFVLGEQKAFELSEEHRKAADRRRRIVVQYDPQELFGIDFQTWLDYRFRYVDEPGTQIDSIFWDMGRLGQVLYPSKFLDPLVNAGLQKWRDQGIDLVGRLVAETRRRGLEVFWHHRISEVDINAEGTGAAWKDGPAPLKRAHPDWVLKTNWWRHGLWNLAVPAVREYTVKALREVAETVRLRRPPDRLRPARALPAARAPVGASPPRDRADAHGPAAWSWRSARKRGRPLLLAAKVPQNLKGCRVDGFDVAAWCGENLVDILTLGSRSVDVDMAGFRRIAGRNIKLQPCFDDHHTTDGYRYAAHRSAARRVRQLVAAGRRQRGDVQLVQRPARSVQATRATPRPDLAPAGLSRDRQPGDHGLQGQDVRRSAARRLSVGRRLLQPQRYGAAAATAAERGTGNDPSAAERRSGAARREGQERDVAGDPVRRTR